MKFSFRQILASAGGAMLAAFIASLFGVKGTIIGVAIGSAAATFGTALVSQSIEHGREAVKQVVVRAPDATSLLRRLGGTSASGDAVSDPAETTAASAPATSTVQSGDQTSAMTAPDVDAESDASLTATTDTVAMASGEPVTEPVPTTSAFAEPVTAELRIAQPMRRSIPWRAIAGTAAIVFVLSLGLVTGIEALAGHPISDLFSHDKSNNPSVGQFFNPGPAPTTTTTPTTSTTTTSTTTTTTSTTTTTIPGQSTTTTTGGGSTTTTSGLGIFGTTTTTTTVPGTG